MNNQDIKRVLEIAEEIINKNKSLNTVELYHIAKRHLNIHRKGLLKIIEFLLNKKILVEGTKFTRTSVLKHHQRKKIYEYIRDNPGVHFSKIKESILSNNNENPGSSGQLLWHLKLLIKFNYIKSKKISKYTVFFPNEINDDIGLCYFILRDKLNKRIINLLIKNKTIKKSSIYKKLNQRAEKIKYRINKLKDYGIIKFINQNNKTISLNESKREILNDLTINFKS